MIDKSEKNARDVVALYAADLLKNAQIHDGTMFESDTLRLYLHAKKYLEVYAPEYLEGRK
jgi:hypothetical protein